MEFRNYPVEQDSIGEAAMNHVNPLLLNPIIYTDASNSHKSRQNSSFHN